jgi:hypothetical protein
MGLKAIDKMFHVTMDIATRENDREMNQVSTKREEVFNKRIGGISATSAVLKAYESVREEMCPGTDTAVKDNIANIETCVDGYRFEGGSA